MPDNNLFGPWVLAIGVLLLGIAAVTLEILRWLRKRAGRAY